jgi:putative sugar O-methyltransferase
MTDALLTTLVADQRSAKPIYYPGPYWLAKSQTAQRLIERRGIKDFRNSYQNNALAESYGDATLLDVRATWQQGYKRLARRLFEGQPFKRVLEGQVALTRRTYEQAQMFKRGYVEGCKASQVRKMLSKYALPDTTTHGCDDVSRFDGKEYSNLYLEMLYDIDHVASYVDLATPRTFLEIGPGFGANAHLILSNFPSIKKYLIIDIVPNVYVATKYLESFYPNSVVNYLDTRLRDTIRFKDDDSVEIIIIPSWQIEKLCVSIDCFWNANSFVEMPADVVATYAKHVLRMRNDRTAFVLISYDQGDLATTLDPETLPRFFDPPIALQMSRRARLCVPDRENWYFTGQVAR